MQIGFFGVLGLIFVALKLTGYVTWSWVWVTCPFWGRLAVALASLFVVILADFLMELRRHRKRK